MLLILVIPFFFCVHQFAIITIKKYQNVRNALEERERENKIEGDATHHEKTQFRLSAKWKCLYKLKKGHRMKIWVWDRPMAKNCKTDSDGSWRIVVHYEHFLDGPCSFYSSEILYVSFVSFFSFSFLLNYDFSSVGCMCELKTAFRNT